MKRISLVLRGGLLAEAMRFSGEKTYSKVVDKALEDFARRLKAQQILQLAGSGLWDGSLSVMRDDRQQRPAKKPR